MGYTFDELIELIGRHDEHEDYYRDQFRALLRSLQADAWEEGVQAAFTRSMADPWFVPHEVPNPYRDEE